MGAMPAMPEPRAADRAEIADMQKQAQDALKSCNTTPAADGPPNCEATMQRLVNKQTKPPQPATEPESPHST
jgi:hypothetical protein